MMKRYIDRILIIVLIVASLLLSACGQKQEEAVAEEGGPAKVEHLQGVDPTRVTLTEDAAKRLDIQTSAVLDTQENGTMQMVIPYAAILYDTQGNTWVYTNPEPLVFVRTPITVDYIEGDQAVLTAGPPSGNVVVIVGAAELYGSESEFEEE
jgi:uncharacterized protein YceK